MYEKNEGPNFDFASDTLPKVKEMPKWQKYLIIGSVTAVFAILLIVIIILIANSGGNNTDKDKGKDDEGIERTVLGKIVCKYEISNTQEPTKILGDQFKNEGNIGVIIAEKKVKYTKEHKFDEIG
jgi:flagellar biosynthesis/type III secretory pathway M-ring protein FliF/YscJ